jgi:hypothetical protein
MISRMARAVLLAAAFPAPNCNTWGYMIYLLNYLFRKEPRHLHSAGPTVAGSVLTATVPV